MVNNQWHLGKTLFAWWLEEGRQLAVSISYGNYYGKRLQLPQEKSHFMHHWIQWLMFASFTLCLLLIGNLKNIPRYRWNTANCVSASLYPERWYSCFEALICVIRLNDGWQLVTKYFYNKITVIDYFILNFDIT